VAASHDAAVQLKDCHQQPLTGCLTTHQIQKKLTNDKTVD